MPTRRGRAAEVGLSLKDSQRRIGAHFNPTSLLGLNAGVVYKGFSEGTVVVELCHEGLGGSLFMDTRAAASARQRCYSAQELAELNISAPSSCGYMGRCSPVGLPRQRHKDRTIVGRISQPIVWAKGRSTKTWYRSGFIRERFLV